MPLPDKKKVITADTESKSTQDILLGVTQVIDKHSLVLLNYSYSLSKGYHADPYKLLSVVDNETGDPLFKSGSYALALYESRPESRLKQSLYAQYKRYLNGDVLDFSYRYLKDDWQVKSNTYELRYMYKTGPKNYLQPHFRYYQQTAVNFYTPYITQEQVLAGLPDHASADYRLSQMDTFTLGIEYGFSRWKIAIEYYLQSPIEAEDKIGNLNNYELTPDVDAWMFRLNFDY